MTSPPVAASLRPARAVLAGALLACALAGVLACADVARAQQPLPDSTGLALGALGARIDSVGTPADSAAAESIAAAANLPPPTGPGFHPSWTTRYSLDRQHSDWSQGLNFTVPHGRFQLDHRTSGGITRDSGTRNTRTERLDSGTTLTFQAADKLKFRLDWVIPKNSYSDAIGSNRDDKNNVTLGGDYALARDGRYDMTFKAEGGRAQSNTRQVSVDIDPEHAGAPFRIDSPRASGLTGTFHGDGNYYIGTGFKLNGRYDYTRERLDNRTRMQWSDSSGTVVDVSDSTSTINNHVRGNTLGASLTAWRPVQMDLTFTDDSRQDEYYLQVINGQETHTYARRGVTSTNTLLQGPMKGSVTVAWGRLEDAHAHFASTDVVKTSLRYDAKLDAWRFWGFTLAGELASDASNEDRPELRATDVSLDGDHYNRSFDLSLDRAITARLTAHAASNLSLQRDAFVNPRNDRDVTVRRGVFSSAWSASKKIALGAGFEASQRNDVSISKRRSANNNTSTSYALTPNYTYKVTSQTTISQGVQVNSDYTVYTFFENRNYYTGKVTINTTLTSQLSPRVKLDMTHSAVVRRQGSYKPTIVSLDPYAVERQFGQTNEDRSQDMRVTLAYKIGTLNFTLAQRVAFMNRFVRCKLTYGRFFCEPDPKGSNRQLSLTPTAAISYNFRGGSRLNVTATRYEVSGTREKPYWRVDSSLSKVFFK